MLGLFKRKDPICGMKEEAGKGTQKYGKWFCNTNCVTEYETRVLKQDGGNK